MTCFPALLCGPRVVWWVKGSPGCGCGNLPGPPGAGPPGGGGLVLGLSRLALQELSSLQPVASALDGASFLLFSFPRSWVPVFPASLVATERPPSVFSLKAHTVPWAPICTPTHLGTTFPWGAAHDPLSQGTLPQLWLEWTQLATDPLDFFLWVPSCLRHRDAPGLW